MLSGESDVRKGERKRYIFYDLWINRYYSNDAFPLLGYFLTLEPKSYPS